MCIKTPGDVINLIQGLHNCTQQYIQVAFLDGISDTSITSSLWQHLCVSKNINGHNQQMLLSSFNGYYTIAHHLWFVYKKVFSDGMSDTPTALLPWRHLWVFEYIWSLSANVIKLTQGLHDCTNISDIWLCISITAKTQNVKVTKCSVMGNLQHSLKPEKELQINKKFTICTNARMLIREAWLLCKVWWLGPLLLINPISLVPEGCGFNNKRTNPY